MKRAMWMAAAFAAGMIASAAATRAKADTLPLPLPLWVAKGACMLVDGGGGIETAVEVQATWVRMKSARAGTAGAEGPELWRNLAVAKWVERRSDESCRGAQ